MIPLAVATDRVRVRSWRLLHPEGPFVLMVALAWIGLGVFHWAGHGPGPEPPWSFNTAAWASMTIAMMLPGVLPMQRWVVFQSLPARRNRASVLFVGTYLVGWSLVGIASAAGIWSIERLTDLTFDPGQGTVTIMLIAAGMWQFTSVKRHALRRCHLRLPLAARAWPADRSVMAYGWFQVRGCSISCGPVMATMFVAAHDFHLMIPLTVSVLHERFQRRPKEAIGAAALFATAALSLVV